MVMELLAELKTEMTSIQIFLKAYDPVGYCLARPNPVPDRRVNQK